MTIASHTFVPAMSDNVWHIVRDTLLKPTSRRYLEWGSGASTLEAINSLLPLDRSDPFEIVTVEHDSNYFRSLIDRTLQLLASSGRRVSIRWCDPAPDADRLAGWRRACWRRVHLESRALPLLWCAGHMGAWMTGKAVADEPQTWAGLVRKTASLLQCRTSFYLEGFLSTISSMKKTPYRPPPGEWTFESAAKDVASLTPDRPQHFILETLNLNLHYYYLPRRRNFLTNHRRIFDGLYLEFFEYVGVPVNGEFDVVLVDGRARSSCIRRVALDSLLAPGGTLFVHDADRVHHMDGYRAFPRHSFVPGSNRRLDGSPQYPPDGGLPIVFSGPSPEEAHPVADRELFFYQRPAN